MNGIPISSNTYSHLYLLQPSSYDSLTRKIIFRPDLVKGSF